MKRVFGLSLLGSAALLTAVLPALAQEASSGPVQTPPAAEARIGKTTVSGDGDLSGDSQELLIRVDKTNLFGSPVFLYGRGKVGQQRQRAYDLHRWGSEIGMGWVLDPQTRLQAGYRLDSYSTFNVSPDSDPAYRDVAGRSDVGALGLLLMRDKRNDQYCATYGYRFRLGGELAVRGWGGDYNFGRLESDFAVYYTPCQEKMAGSLWEDLILVEHLRLGWMEAFGSNDETPFFERYFVGGGNTVRGHRGDWLSPRRLDDQFIGGGAELVNNIEARLPVFKDTFRRRLFAVTFFDMGRSYRRFSHIGDFGYGAGVGLHYIVHFWQIHGVLRADFGVNLAPEGDDSSTRLNIVFGSPF